MLDSFASNVTSDSNSMPLRRRAPEKMDCTQLVLEVFERRPLWQRNHKQHHNRSVLDQLWDEVADIVGSTRDGCRRRWKSLKDNFRRELKKTEETMFKSTWPHYDSLLFLKDQMISSFLADPLDLQTHTKLEVFENSSNEAEKIGDDTETYEGAPQGFDAGDSLPSTSTTRARRGRRKKQKVKDDNESLNETENMDEIILAPQITHDIPRKDNEYENTSESDDYFFFMSLIPHVQNFNSIQKLRLRNKIQQLIIDEACGVNINNSNNTNSH